MSSKYSDRNDKDFIRALNKGVKLEYDVKHSTLLNNVMFITAQVINKSLKMDIFDYEKDAFSHNFFLESGVNTFVEGMFNEDYPEMNSVNEIEEIAINRLQKMQDYLKNLCKKIIQSKEDLILESKYIIAPLLYDLYNNGNCLSQEYTNIKDKVLNYLGIDLNNLTDEMIYDINNNLLYIIYNFGIPEISTYLNAFSNSNSRNIYKFKFGNYNLFDLLFNNLDLMAKHLIGHCLMEIFQILKHSLMAVDIKEASSKLETFFLNGLIPEGFSKEEEELYKECIGLWEKGCLKFDGTGQFQVTDKFIETVHNGDYSGLAGFSFLREDIGNYIFKDGSETQMPEEIEQLVLEDYLGCDYRRAGIDKYDRKLLEDAGRGHWDLWEDSGSKQDMLPVNTPLVGRNPVADIRWDGVAGIDFGTKSTVVVYQDGNASMYPMRIGSGNYKKEASSTDYENPTVMQFIHLEKFLESYNAKEGRPGTLWEDVNISHTAAEALKMASSGEYYSYFSDLKQWCGDKNRHVRIRDRDGFEITLPAFTGLEDGSFNPVELYAYFLGLFINNMHRGIFIDYILSFPVTYEKTVRDKILQSFKAGLWKSLPVHVQHDERVVKNFCVSQGASEPAAYAACAFKEYGFNPEEGGKVFYGIFDFGGGTADFDFGLWRAPANVREESRYDYVIEHFGASGDQYLGGENLLELLAFAVFKRNLPGLREAGISFTKPHEARDFPGCEAFIKNSQEAKLNTRQLMEALRGLWEHNNPGQVKNIEAGEIKVQLFSDGGERIHNFGLKTDKAELEQILRDRIKEGVDNFFNALKLNFDRDDVAECDCINIFLAGNSSKSPVVWELFEEQIKERTDRLNKKLKAAGKEADTEHTYYRIFPPLGVTEQDIRGQNETGQASVKKDTKEAKSKGKNLMVLKPTGKTGVAYGLLLCRKGGKIKDVPEKKQDEEAKFRYYLGREKKGCFKVIISTSVKYGQWTEFIDASVDKFDIYCTSSPNATTNQLPIVSDFVFLKKCTIKEENTDASIYIRAVAPTIIEYVVATEEGIKEGKFLEEPVRIELSQPGR